MGIIGDFIGLFYPRCCLACSTSLVKGEEVFCTGCLTQLPKTSYHYRLENPVKTRLSGRLPLEFGFAFLRFRKGGIVQNLLHELKYNNHPEIGVRIGKLYGKELMEAGFENKFDLIVPVPLHASRKRKRGYNQSAMFAVGLSEAMGIAWEESISFRMVATKTQTKKGKADRWHNVKNAFSMPAGNRIHGQRILLVDDVITTGATLEACGQHLVDNKCMTLSIACIAEA